MHPIRYYLNPIHLSLTFFKFSLCLIHTYFIWTCVPNGDGVQEQIMISVILSRFQKFKLTYTKQKAFLD
jgi:hypothetical protein